MLDGRSVYKSAKILLAIVVFALFLIAAPKAQAQGAVVDSDLYNQIKMMLLIGLIHSVVTVIVTQWLKSVVTLGPVGKRLFPLLWSITVTLPAFPYAMTLVGLPLPTWDWYVSVAALVAVGTVGAGLSLQLYNFWDVMKHHVIEAIKTKVKTWSSK